MKKNIENFIDVPTILKALEDHIVNGRDMTVTQVNAALAILKRVYPEDKPNTKQNDIETTLTHEEALKLLDDR